MGDAGAAEKRLSPLLIWKRLSRLSRICAWLDSSWLAAADSSLVAELVCTTAEI